MGCQHWTVAAVDWRHHGQLSRNCRRRLFYSIRSYAVHLSCRRRPCSTCSWRSGCERRPPVRLLQTRRPVCESRDMIDTISVALYAAVRTCARAWTSMIQKYELVLWCNRYLNIRNMQYFQSISLLIVAHGYVATYDPWRTSRM